jgi:hypothetical protein
LPFCWVAFLQKQKRVSRKISSKIISGFLHVITTETEDYRSFSGVEKQTWSPPYYSQDGQVWNPQQ